jgi:DNA-binding transcriptional ArsR family regulator
MGAWTDPQDNPVLASVTALARELSDPIRLTALQLLAVEGPHTMSRLADAIGVSPSRLGNHLTRLRAEGLVTVEHTGRHAVYGVADPAIGEVLSVLSRYATGGPVPGPPETPHETARTCYDHIAGRLGVAVYATLTEGGALVPPAAGGELSLGSHHPAFDTLGVEVAAVVPGRRKLATACLDKSLRLPHLGGALGNAVLDAFLRDGLVTHGDGARELTVTPKGRDELPTLLPALGPVGRAGEGGR